MNSLREAMFKAGVVSEAHLKWADNEVRRREREEREKNRITAGVRALANAGSGNSGCGCDGCQNTGVCKKVTNE